MAQSEKAKTTTSINLELRNIPIHDNNILNALAKLRGIPKWKIIQEACSEYAKNHLDDIAKIMKDKGTMLPSVKAVLEANN